MSVLNITGQLLLPMVGVARKELKNFKVNMVNIGFKYKGYNNNKIIPYTLFLRMNLNIKFIEYLKKNISFLKFYTNGDEHIVMLECLPENKEDWNYIVEGRYSKVSYRGKEKILNNVEERKEQWKKIFNKSKKDILEHIENNLSSKKYTPMKRREVAEDLYKDIKPSYEMFHKIKKEFV